MRQLRPSASVPLGLSTAATEKVDLPSDHSPIVLFGLMFFGAFIAGFVATRLTQPINYVLVAVMAIGGVSASFLAFVIPAQTILFSRKSLIRLGLSMKRARLRARLDIAHARLVEDAGEAGEAGEASALSDLAVVEHLRGAQEAAQRQLAEALELAPEDPTLLNNLGAVLAATRQYDRGAQMFARALGDAAPPEVRENLALIAPLVRDPEPLKRLQFHDPDSEQALAMNNMGVWYMKQGQADVAREWFGRALRMDPKHGHSWANLGLLAYQRDRQREAAGHLIKAARLTPGDARIANDLAVVFAAIGKPRWSRQQLAAATALEPANVGIKINALSVHALEGHVELAIRGLRSLVGAPYHGADACYNLAVLQLVRQDYEAAAEFSAKGIEDGDHSSDAFTNLAVAFWELEQRAQALSHFQSAYQANDAGPRAASNLGRALMLEDRVEEALTVLDEGRQRWRSDSHLALDMASALLLSSAKRHRPNLSLVERRQFFADLHRSCAGLEAAALRSAEPSPEAHLNLGLYLYLREEYEKAAEQFQETADLQPSMVELHLLVGTSYGRAADQQRTVLADGTRALDTEGTLLAKSALPHLRKACDDREAPADAFYNAGRVLYALQEYEQALDYLRKGARLEDSEEMNTLAGLSSAREARDCLNSMRTQSLMSDTKKDALKRRAAQFMDAAVQYLRQALLRNELDPTLHGNIGLAYMLRNREHDVEAALRHWQRMRSIVGEELSKRYTAFTQIQSAEHASRVQFDDSDISCRDVNVPDWVATPPVQPAGLRYVLEPVSEQHDWRLIAHSETLRSALKVRERIAQSEAALARLEA